MSVVCRLIRQSGPFRRSHAFFPHDRDKNKRKKKKNLGRLNNSRNPPDTNTDRSGRWTRERVVTVPDKVCGDARARLHVDNNCSPVAVFVFTLRQNICARNAILHSVNTLRLTGGYAPAGPISSQRPDLVTNLSEITRYRKPGGSRGTSARSLIGSGMAAGRPRPRLVCLASLSVPPRHLGC